MSLYDQHADTLLLAAMTAAIKATGDHNARVERTFEGAERAAAEQYGGRVQLAGIIAAHALPPALKDVDDVHDTALESVASKALPALRDHRGLGSDADPLGKARHIISTLRDTPASLLDGPLRGALDDLARMLRTTGGEHQASCGHLVRDVVQDMRRYLPHLGNAWFGVLGGYVLLPKGIVRAAVVGMVNGGREKSRVAEIAGISRTTLNSWVDLSIHERLDGGTP